MNPFDEIVGALGAIQDAVAEVGAAIVKASGMIFAGLGIIAGILAGIMLAVKVLAAYVFNGLTGATEAATDGVIGGIIPWWLTLGASIGGLLGAAIIWHGAKEDGWLE